jgi:ribosomal protein L17
MTEEPLRQDSDQMPPTDRSAPHSRPRKVHSGMWGIPEMIVAGFGLLGVLAFVLLLAFLVLPAQTELENNKARRNEIERDLTTARTRYGSITTTKERVGELIRSADDFEARSLRSENDAKVALYQRLNGLMTALRLVNTSGPDYVPLDISGRNGAQTAEDRSGRSRFVSIFPGTYVTLTVDGTYQNLRRFIREIETGGEFILISAVELEPSENKDNKRNAEQPNPAEAPAPVRPGPIGQPESPTGAKVDRGKYYGETVTLRMELAAYFRRPGFSPLPLDTTSGD